MIHPFISFGRNLPSATQRSRKHIQPLGEKILLTVAIISFCIVLVLERKLSLSRFSNPFLLFLYFDWWRLRFNLDNVYLGEWLIFFYYLDLRWLCS